MIPRSGFCGILAPGAAKLGAPYTLPAPPLRSGDGALLCAAWDADGRHVAHAVEGDRAVVVHGEIHNSVQLGRELGLPPDAGLAQVLLAGWQRWSRALLQRLDGIHALALRDGAQLWLARDPSGLRDLHWQVHDGRIAFATHLDVLPVLPGAKRTLARRSLHEYLRLLDIAAPSTLYEGVRAVEEGRLLRWAVGSTVPSLEPDTAVSGPLPADFDAAVDALDAHLQRSVRTRLAGARRPAAFLSGGIDSALLCAIAARQRPDLTAITVGFEGGAFDEAPVAQRIAGHVGVTHEVWRFGRDEYLQALQRLGQTTEQPMADPATPATVLAFDRCRSHFDAVLDGTGADEAVGLMPARHARLAVEWTSLLPGAARARLATMLRALPPLAPYADLFAFEHPADTLTRWNGFRAREIEALCGEPVSLDHTRLWQTFARYRRGAHFERYSALLDAMPGARLNQSMLSAGATVRYPFWDGETNRLLRQLRTDWRYLPGQPKRILRALLARYVPASIWSGPKHGFTFPLQEFLAGEDHALVRRHLDPALWASRALLSPDGVATIARRFIGGERRLVFRVWALVVLSAWLEGHGEPRM